ncbi:MAG: hypothetical protein EAZ51_02250 [Sphingobacteriales bacterium]|nr:MAG: hypothetical protein EAZ64_02145 [Sphingobacteriales bacterium]TAF82549.1 MAG: hypothetical protein EAZ51_02250 [Sphingobacteriales bacterium]
MIKNTFKNANNYIFIALLAWILGYVLFFYHITSRQNITYLFLILALLFATYFYVLVHLKKYEEPKNNLLFYISIIFRLLPLASIPFLSDDFYRFIWDGQLLHQYINPFAYTPLQIINGHSEWLAATLWFKKLNSPLYYTVYPPVNQFIFWLSGFAPKNNLHFSVIIMRLCLLAFDIGTLILLKKLLIIKKLKPKLVYVYALNPLVIIEFVGNLHFEVAMLFFTFLAVYLLCKQKNNWSAVSLGLAVCSKLLPLVFIPLMVRQIGWLKTLKYGFIVLATALLLFFPFIHNKQLCFNFIKSLQLYYGTFEFNGSFYQLFKYIGWLYWGYNPITYISKILFFLTFVGFVFCFVKSRNIFEGLFFLVFVHCILSAIVHPWYILPLVAFSPFIPWRFGVVWSALIGLSYFTYKAVPYQESMLVLGVEYFLLFAFIWYEVYCKTAFKIVNK